MPKPPKLPKHLDKSRQTTHGSSLSKQPALKQKVIKGGLYLTLRQLVSVGLSILSILVIARVLGPKDYGILVNALGIFYFIIWTGKLGLHVYLIQQKQLPDDAPEQVLNFFNLLSVVFAVGLLALAPAIAHWTQEPAIGHLVQWLPLPIAAEMAASVSVAMLERNLAFTKVGLIEIGAQIANYAVALPLVILGWRYWGPLIGLGVRSVVMLALAQYAYPVGWQWQLKRQFLQPALRYGLTFSLSHWVISLRSLTIPVLVTPIGGIELAGLVSIAIRLAEQLSILRMVIRRMSISVMAKLTDDAEAVRQTLSRGMAYQALLIGTVCSAFACVDSWIVPRFFGSDWLQSTYIFPFIALSAMVRAMFDLHSGALYALHRNSEVTKAYVIYIGLLWVGCGLLLPVFGLWGYGLAELLTILSNIWLHRSIVKLYGKPQYSAAAWLTIAAMIPILGSLRSPLIGIVSFILSYGAVLLVTDVRAVPLELFKAIRPKLQKQ
ncbi:MAG: oligosaccharide flippase family protein [Cyanobacteria bacterium P01_D01_bin.105]